MAIVGNIYDIKKYDDYILQMYYNVVPYNWYNGSNILINASDVETGEFNTQLIVNEQGLGTYAASVANSLIEGGYEDWYLPSVNEFESISNSGIVTSGGFWTSTEDGINNAFLYNFELQSTLSLSKSGNFPVLMVRKEYTTDVVTIERMNVQSKNAPILRGGEYNADEDVYKMLGGINGTSKNSKILSNE